MTTARSQSRTWWLHPVVPVIASTAPVIYFSAATGAVTYWQNWGTPKYLDAGHLATLALFVAAFAFGAALAARNGNATLTEGATPDVGPEVLRRAGVALGVIALCGYVAWGLIGVARGMAPGDFVSAFTGEPGAISRIKRDYLTPVAGVSSFAQFGVPAVAALSLAWRLGAKVPWRLVLPLLACAAIRAQVYGERLALIELALACLVAMSIPVRSLPPLRWVRYVPILLPAAVFAMFAFFEYFRSWLSYYSEQTTGSYLSFIVERLQGYYLTATNNSALLDKFVSDELPFPYFTLGFFWNAPGVAQVAGYESLFGYQPSILYSQALSGAANPEFNNPGGILLPLVDYGLAGGTLFWGIAGFVFAYLYRLARARIEFVPLYAACFIGFLEINRYVYWTQGRAFAALIGALAVVLYSTRHTTKS